MKKFLFVLATMVVLVAGCGNEENDSSKNDIEGPKAEEKLKEEKLSHLEKQQILMDFVNEDISRISYYEVEANKALATVSGQNYRNDQKLYEVLVNEVLPTYKKAVDRAAAIEVEMEELEPIKVMVEEATNTFYKALLIEKEALEKQDIELIEEANVIAEEYDILINEYHEEMKKLSEKYNVIYEPSQLDIA
ncbi:hypothetical protein [Mesobacillus zeae]|uniref:Lipoprotein n=1 Tax=Mesobacillus zeae TaxID=1917180 RepID=A0A398BD41_9BACI|nr:hypothetical protein [Mesobacillus zeae]RID86738.1 hypothetical protein D1970_05635 [Mesobacillus zeae]